MISKKLKFALFVASTFSSTLRAEFNSSGVTNALTCRNALCGAMFVRVSDGKTLYEKNADALLSPASVTKVITSAAVLANFGPAFSFKTPILHTGRLTQGRLSGDLIIQGNGDPFLVSEILWQTAIDLRHLGIKSIEGNIIIDTSLFDPEDRDQSRAEGIARSTHAYDAPVSAFAVNFNTVAVAIAPTVSGQNALTSVTPFSMPHVKLTGRVGTTKGASSDSVNASRTSQRDGGISISTSGLIGEEAPIKKIYRSVSDPMVAAGDYFKGFLLDAGISIKGTIKTGIAPRNAGLLYEIQGYEMRRIAAGLNTFSNNFIADMLTKRLGAAFPLKGEADLPRSGSLANGIAVLARFLKDDVGIKTPFTLLNGSGLSIENRLSARQVMSVLTWMEKQGGLFPDFLGSLPANGWDGTLKKRMKNSDNLAGIIRAKTGTLTEPITVAGMAGYFRHPTEGWVAFVMIGNGREGVGQPGLMDLRNQQDNAIKSLF